jgi:hypothetical protein
MCPAHSARPVRATPGRLSALALLPALLWPGPAVARAQAVAPATAQVPAPAGRSVWRDRMPWPDACEEAFQEVAGGEGEGVEVVPLGRGRALLRIECDRFAYQGSQVFGLWDEASASGRLLDFGETAASAHNTAEPEEGSEARPEVVGLATVDAAAGELTVLTRFRGAGDCGALATYALLDGALALRRLRLQEACDGASVDPEQWPEVDPATAPATATATAVAP